MVRTNFNDIIDLIKIEDTDKEVVINLLKDLEHRAIKDELLDFRYTDDILDDNDFVKNRTLVACTSWYARDSKLIDMVLFYGYDKVNNCLLELLHEKSNKNN